MPDAGAANIEVKLESIEYVEQEERRAAVEKERRFSERAMRL